jgi:hypothetical protein
MGQSSALANLIRRGRRRQLSHLLLDVTSFSIALALGGAIILLLVGTQIFNWYWLALLFTLSLASGVYRSRGKALSAYQVAQSIDRQLGFQDSLSTAHYFSEHPNLGVSTPEFVERQRQVAEALARGADVRRGVPFLAPRTYYLNAALAIAVIGMVGLRYGINRSLDLRPSLVHIAFEGFLGSPRDIANAKAGRQARPFEQNGQHDPGLPFDQTEPNASDLNPAPGTDPDAADSDANAPGDAKGEAKSKAEGTDQQQTGDDLDSDKGQESPPGSDGVNDPNSAPRDGAQAGKQQNGSKNSDQSANSGENSSLTSKMRDALANLMAKLKKQSNQGGSRQESQPPGSQTAQRQNQASDGSSKSASQQQADANSAEAGQGEQQQSGAQQNAQGKNGAKSAQQPDSPDGKSGIGKQDGDKTAREAAELAAMGKISEIIGKRSANVTGEVMVEVASGKQQLKTQYSDKNATHVDNGGEINRDEIPLAYQRYVQQYFEEIRKLPAGKNKPPADGKLKNSGS